MRIEKKILLLYPSPSQFVLFYGLFNPVSPFAYLQMNPTLVKSVALPVNNSWTEKTIVVFMSHQFCKCKRLGFFIVQFGGSFNSPLYFSF